jgi:NAD(P)-dependent dehydrogenase (short-subunit alcohol dehydrogenase family)
VSVAGAGPGLGLAVAKRFGEAGYRLALLARRADAVCQVASELAMEGMEGMETRGFAADAGDEASFRRQFHQMDGSLGPTEMLVYNAFAFHQASPTELQPSDLISRWLLAALAPIDTGRYPGA